MEEPARKQPEGRKNPPEEDAAGVHLADDPAPPGAPATHPQPSWLEWLKLHGVSVLALVVAATVAVRSEMIRAEQLERSTVLEGREVARLCDEAWLLLGGVPLAEWVSDLTDDSERIKEASSLVLEAGVLDPRSARVLVMKGLILLADERPFEALRVFDGAVALAPHSVGAHVGRGSALQRLTRIEEAVMAFDQAIALDPRNVVAHLNRGNALFALNQREEAIAAVKRALRSSPLGARLHSNLGVMLRRTGRFEEALSANERAIALAPEDSVAHSNYGATLGAMGHLHKALVAFDRAIELDPANEGAQAGRRKTLQELEAAEGAVSTIATPEPDPGHQP